MSNNVSVFVNQDFFLRFTYLFLVLVGLHCCAQTLGAVGLLGYSSLQCSGSLLQWLLLLQNTGCRHMGFSSCSSSGLGIVAHGL